MIQQYITVSASHIFLLFSSHFHNHPPIFPIPLLCSLPLRGLRTPPASGSLLRSFTSLLPLAQRPQDSSRWRAPPQVIIRSAHSENLWFSSFTGFALSIQHLSILPAGSQIYIYCFGTAHCLCVYSISQVICHLSIFKKCSIIN